MSEARFGLVGRDIAYSLSPAIFQWAFQRSGVEGRYEVYDHWPEELSSLLRSSDWDGLNVTIPYKRDVIEFCENLSSQAARCGAVNTLTRRAGEVSGDNTDVAGFAAALAHLSDPTQMEQVLVVGSGGAARAVCVALHGCTDAAITLASRDLSKARRAFESLLVSVCSLEAASALIPEFDLIVNATPVGTAAHPGVPLEGVRRIRPESCVMDLVYAPRRTLLLEQAQSAGARVQNGLPMLIAQALASFQIWTGFDMPLSAAIHELLPRLEHHDSLSHRG